MEVNKKYTEIMKLHKMLSAVSIPHSVDRIFDGWQIVYFYNGKQIADVVQHSWSYGADKNLLEIMGLLTSEEEEHDTVLGYLTAEKVFERIRKDFLNRKFGTRRGGY